MQDDVSGLQLAFVVKHHGVDPSYGVVLEHTEKNNDTIKTVHMEEASLLFVVSCPSPFLTTFPALRMVWYLFM